MAWSSRRGSRFHRDRQQQRPSTLKTCSTSGFTLVEMLVSVTLVLLMMVMFGEMFQLASGSVVRQRTLADNDQNARTFVTLMRADLDKRSFRTVVPFFPGELSANPGTPFVPRKGYFYISCNNLADATDDLLQFTVLSSTVVRNADESPYYGRATQLYNVNPAPLTASQKLLNFLTNPNQPDRDDGQVTSDSAGSSRAAEVAYWMRAGKLYRRSMLLRDPIPAAGTSPDPLLAAQPTPANASVSYFDPAFVFPYTGNFWADFDFSAHMKPTLPPFFVQFNSVDYLANDTSVFPYPGGFPWMASLGQSWNRFGHNHLVVANNTTNGLSREYGSNAAVPPSNAMSFFGRFSQEETSNGAFLYPQFPSTVGNGNPMDGNTTASPANTFVDGEDANGNGILDAGEDTNGNGLLDGSDGVIDSYAGGSRVGVDLLLSHVHEFRVEVWDDRLFQFVPVGHSLPGVVGDYNIARRLNGTYGPLNPVGVSQFNVFDTWHPRFDRNFNGVLGDGPDRPPYRPLNWDPTPAAVSVPSGPVPPSPAPLGASAVQGYWEPGQTYSLGQVIFPRTEDLNGNGFLDPGEDGSNGFPANGVLDRRLTEDINGNNVLDAGEDGTYGFPTNGKLDSTSPPFFPFGLTYSYRCTKAGTSGPLSSSEPHGGAWSTTIGQVITEPGGAGPDWVVEYNPRPLKAIRLTVRFEHPTSKTMKQVTLVHALRDTTSVP